jgi:hypothetical protein
MTIVCVTSKQSLGCSFVDWSINFLSGRDQYFKIDGLKWTPLTSNPLTAYNSHGHKKNHPAGYRATSQYIEEFLKQSPDLYTVYPSMIHVDDVCQQLNIPHQEVYSHFDQICQHSLSDFQNIINSCFDYNVKLIYVHGNAQARGYFWNQRALDRQILNAEPYRDFEHARLDFQQVFFNNSIDSWNRLNLTNTWDVRERMALDMRPYDLKFYNNDVSITFPHVWVDCQDLWYNTTDVLDDIMKFINVPIDQQRWSRWIPIMQTWQTIQRNQLKFYYVVDHIVNSIVHNWYYPLESLSLAQEAVIQHCLIYKHNLNLKTWQLETFPANTQDLHKLIEPNFHIVPSIY